jgi:hypothetical protein
LKRFAQHRLLDASLLQAQRLLPGPLFLLLPLVFFGLCNKPVTHRLLLAVPLVRWLWNDTQGLRQGSRRRRWRWWLPARVWQGHGRGRRQATMRSRHVVGGDADRQRGHPWRVDSGVQRRTRSGLRIAPEVMRGPATNVKLGRVWDGEQHGHVDAVKTACDSRRTGAVAMGRAVVLCSACDGRE